MRREDELLALAAKVEAIGIENALTLADRKGGTVWAQKAADCLTTAAALRARAALAAIETGAAA